MRKVGMAAEKKKTLEEQMEILQTENAALKKENKALEKENKTLKEAKIADTSAGYRPDAEK